MSVYLLTWNPKHFSTDEEGGLNYQQGEQVRWSCHSQQPQIGDTVYLVRVGVDPRGIVAKGRVTKESYLAPHWLDETKQKPYIEFELEELRLDCQSGLLPMMLLQAAMTEQKWSPQTSGIAIKPEYQAQLAELWQQGQGKHSVAQFFTWFLANQFPQHWYETYIETCQLAKQLQETKVITEQDVKKLWYGKGNGIASVGQGFMYQKEFTENEAYLHQLTKQILFAPTEETYQKLRETWYEQGTFKRILWAVIHRVFAAASPERYTSIVGQHYIDAVFSCLMNQYQLEVKRHGTWLTDNTNLLSLTEQYLPQDIDYQTRNILLWSLFEWRAVEDSAEVCEENSEYEASKAITMTPSTLNQIYYGPPGTGKTYQLQQLIAGYTSAEPQAETITRYSTVTFHQSYGYEEFIEGIRATTNDAGELHYSIESGAFLKLCQRAERDPEHRYAMFIDEINRGNISKIFGELISLIEVDKRAGCKNQLSVKLPYSGNDFSVPANVDIIGTMNTADRSLALMDTALRRRFDFVEMMPNPKVLEGYVVKGIDLQTLLETLNERIEILYDREHTLGHAFFMPVKVLMDEDKEDQAFEQLASVFNNKILPLLEEYFFEDWSKIRLVLADNQKTDKALQFVTEHTQSHQDLNRLFGNGHGLDEYEQKVVTYQLRDKSAKMWQNPQAYIGIYQAVAQTPDAEQAQ